MPADGVDDGGVVPGIDVIGRPSGKMRVRRHKTDLSLSVTRMLTASEMTAFAADPDAHQISSRKILIVGLIEERAGGDVFTKGLPHVFGSGFKPRQSGRVDGVDANLVGIGIVAVNASGREWLPVWLKRIVA